MSEEIVYICDRCGERFTLTDAERHYFDGELITYCPGCGKTDFEEGKRCKVCGEICHEYELRSGVCKGCFGDAVAAYKAYLGYLQPWEREVLEDEYGAIDITERED